VDTEKIREHDCNVTGSDYNTNLQMLVTSDEKGFIRLWNHNKKYLREIQMPTPCDSICFRNPRGDLLVSHSNRVSLIKLETYWTRVLDYYGVTDSTTDNTLFKVAADDASLYSEAVI
jgi:hypothetical protein